MYFFNVFNSTDDNPTQNQSRLDNGNSKPSNLIRTSSNMPSIPYDHLNKEEIAYIQTSQPLSLNSNNQNPTSVNEYSPDKPSNAQVNIQYSSSSSVSSPEQTQPYSLFKLSKRQNLSQSMLNAQVSYTVDGNGSNDNINNKQMVSKGKNKNKSKNNCCITFFRCIFCRCLASNSNATVTPAINNQITNNKNDFSPASVANTTTRLENYSKVKLLKLSSEYF